MARPTPVILRSEAEGVITGEVIEDYPGDTRGHSCLLLGAPAGRAVHVVCSPEQDYLAVVTVYIPDAALWTSDFRQRKAPNGMFPL